MRPKALNYPPNPDYGAGVCRRRIAIEVEPGFVRGHLSDNFHEMRCRIRHDGRTITGIEAETVRIPTTACPAAVGQLRSLIGLPIDTPTRLFYSGGRARTHCTHLLDLVVIAIRHANGEPGITIYEARVPDEIGAPVPLSIARNGMQIHKWWVLDGVIVDPPALAGQTLDNGFAAWASEAFNEEECEAATILSRTWLIAVGRRYLVAEAAGKPTLLSPEMFDRCFAYSKPQVDSAVFTGEPEHEPPF